jgi:hypothetical protein
MADLPAFHRSMQNRIQKLMDIRFVLALLTVVDDFCFNASWASSHSPVAGLGGDERENFAAYDLEVPRKQVTALIDRLAWCPAMHRHFVEVVRETPEYGVLKMATQDAGGVSRWLKEVQQGTDDGSEYRGKGKGREIER